MEYLLPQSETDEFVSTGLKEVLDVFLPAHTQILDSFFEHVLPQSCTRTSYHTAIFHVSAHTHTNKHKSTEHCISFLKSHHSNCRRLCVKVSDPPADPYLICSFIVNAVKSEHSQHNTTKRCLFQSAVKSRYDNWF